MDDTKKQCTDILITYGGLPKTWLAEYHKYPYHCSCPQPPLLVTQYGLPTVWFGYITRMCDSSNLYSSFFLCYGDPVPTTIGYISLARQPKRLVRD